MTSIFKTSFVTATLLLFQSCAQFPSTSYRSISSTELRAELLENREMSIHFDDVFQSDTAYTFFNRAFKDHADLYYYNQGLVYAFDDALKKNLNPMDIGLYEEIWDGRDLKEHSDEVLNFYLVKLDETTREGTAEDSDKAAQILSSIYDELMSLEDHQKLPYLDTIEIFKGFEIKDRFGRKSNSVVDLARPFAGFDSSNFKWEKFYDQNEDLVRQETLSRVNPQMLNSNYWTQKRSGQKRVIFPSTGREGNLLGGNFPNNVWVLTYDDGPKPATTRRILELLHRNGVKATFFWLAQNAVRNPGMIDLAKQLGMELANHSYTHADLHKQSRAGLNKEIIESTDALERAYGQPVRFFRLPYGSGVHNSEVRKTIANRNLIHVFWNVDSLDWQDKNPRSIHNRVTTQMERLGKGIILFHDIHNQSVEASELLVSYIKERNRRGHNLQFKTLEAVVAQINGSPVQSSGPRTLANLNVRTGPGTNHSVCAVLPEGTAVRVVRDHGTFVQIDVVNPTSGLTQILNACLGSYFVSKAYISQ